MDFGRRFLGIAAALLALSLVSPSGYASVARALRLPELVRSSQHVVIGVPSDSWSRWENSAGGRRIVTYTRVRVEESVSGVPSEAELLVRTLGGQVGNIGQVVYGEAILTPGQRSLLFVRPGPDGALRLTGMAQGHFPLKADVKGVFKVVPSPHLGKLVDPRDSAVARLAGQTLAHSQRLIAEAARR
jgi:hypothetical protein